MALTSPPVSALSLETSVLTLWAEWLAQYFDGASHTVGRHPAVTFPACVLRFQQSTMPQPLGESTGITVTWVDPGAIEREWEWVDGAQQQVYFGYCSWLFWVRSAAENSAESVMVASELLFGLLGNAMETRALAGKGIHHLRPFGPQLVVKEPEFAMRMVKCRGQLRWGVMSQ